MSDCFDPDVHAGMSGIRKLNWNCLGHNLVALDRLVTVNYLMIRGQQQLHAFSFCALPEIEEEFVLQQIASDGEPVAPESFWRQWRCLFGFVAQTAYVYVAVWLFCLRRWRTV